MEGQNEGKKVELQFVLVEAVLLVEVVIVVAVVVVMVVLFLFVEVRVGVVFVRRGQIGGVPQGTGYFG